MLLVQYITMLTTVKPLHPLYLAFHGLLYACLLVKVIKLDCLGRVSVDLSIMLCLA